jgi:hypothetical protein
MTEPGAGVLVSRAATVRLEGLGTLAGQRHLEVVRTNPTVVQTMRTLAVWQKLVDLREQ